LIKASPSDVSLRSAIITFDPAWAAERAKERLIPLPPPVMTQILEERGKDPTSFVIFAARIEFFAVRSKSGRIFVI